MQIHHLTFTSRRRGIRLFVDEAHYRAALVRIAGVAAQAVSRVATRVGLALLALVDDHFHQLVHGTVEAVGRWIQATRCSLNGLVATELDDPDDTPVTTGSHLRWLVKYFLEQPEHHDLSLDVHPGLFVGSCLPDLLGARRLPGPRLCISTLLPRLHQSTVLGILKLPTVPLEPADDEALRRAGPAGIVAASSAAFAADPALRGNGPLVVRARRAAAQLGRAAGFSTAAMARALSVSPRTVRHLAVAARVGSDLIVVGKRIALEARALSSHRRES